MRSRKAGGVNLYNADNQMHYNEKQLAVFAYIVGLNPNDVDSLDIEVIVEKLRAMWMYSSDLRSAGEPTYTHNALPRFFAKMNTILKDRARRAAWNYSLAKAAKNGQ